MAWELVLGTHCTAQPTQKEGTPKISESNGSSEEKRKAGLLGGRKEASETGPGQGLIPEVGADQQWGAW